MLTPRQHEGSRLTSAAVENEIDHGRANEDQAALVAMASIQAVCRTETSPPRPIGGTVLRVRDTATLEPRDWLYRRFLIRGFISGSFGAGGHGKSILTMKDVVSMAVGFDLDNRQPFKRGPLRVWYINVEDPEEEVERRFQAILKRYEVTDEELGRRLFYDADREGRYLMVRRFEHEVLVDDVVVAAFETFVRENRIDSWHVDPFVHVHEVSENDNVDMAHVVGQLRGIADRTGSSGHIIHHVRKGIEGEIDAESGRGAGAIKDACRAVRLIVPMSADDAKGFGIDDDERRFYGFANPTGKPNLQPPRYQRDWFRMVSVPLGNARELLDEDEIGVPCRMEPAARPR